MTEENINSVAENLMVLQPLLYKNLLKPVKSKSTPLSPGALFVMGALKNHDILSMSEIGRKLDMPKPHVTGLIDKLIAESLVKRINDPKDRRIINIQITPKGVKKFISLKKEISEDLRNKLTKLDEATLHTLLTASEQVKEILTSILKENGGVCCNFHSNTLK